MNKKLPLPKALARRVRDLREAREWTQTKLAERAGVPQPRISEIESGETDHRVGTLERVAKAFGLTLSELLENGK